jgi:murein tripeptide amidase MpaA
MGWHRSGCEIEYYQNGYYLTKNRPLHTLSFVYEFEHEDD